MEEHYRGAIPGIARRLSLIGCRSTARANNDYETAAGAETNVYVDAVNRLGRLLDYYPTIKTQGKKKKELP